MKPISEMSFEEAISELEQLIKDLDSGQVALEKSVELYERGALLKAHCEKRLTEAELKIKEITKGGDGKVSVAPADDF